MPRYGAFTVRADCLRCGQPVPINGPFQSMHCAACQADTPVHDGLWAVLLTKLDDDWAQMPEGAASRLTKTIDGPTYHCSFARSVPRCDKCGAALPTDVPLEVERDVFCTACGDGASVYPAPRWLRYSAPNAQQVTSVDRGGGVEARGARPAQVVQAPAPVVMACPQCGGALQLTGDSERTAQCRFCSVDVYLPDDLWKRLHPVRTVREWYVRFDGETAAHRIERERAAREAQREQRAQEALARQSQEQEADALQLDAEIEGLKRTAYWSALAVWMLFFVTVAWGLVATAVPALDDARLPVGCILLGASLVAVVTGIVLSGRPIQRRTGFDGSFMFFAQWFFLIFALVMPGVGQIMALVIAILRLASDSIGGATITSGSSRTYYPVKSLPRGEGKPLGVVYLAMALLYPAAVYLLFGNLSGHP